MKDNKLTDTFSFLQFPKPIKEDKGFKRYGIPVINKRRQAKKLTVAVSKAGKKKKRAKLPSIKSLKAKADRLFSLYIRKRDKNKCVLCNSHKDIQCGHLIKRGKMATRYDEINCHALCSSCNYKDNFEHDHYVLWFLKSYGALPYQDLVDRSKLLVKANREFFNNIIDKYSVLEVDLYQD